MNSFHITSRAESTNAHVPVVPQRDSAARPLPQARSSSGPRVIHPQRGFVTEQALAELLAERAQPGEALATKYGISAAMATRLGRYLALVHPAQDATGVFRASHRA